jgi:protein-S-isoprenylcysteine O-methyltransferase Ste14
MGLMADRWYIAGWAGLAGFLALEASARKSGDASSLDAAPEDRSTTRTVAATYAAAGAIVPLVRLLPGARLPRAAAIAGLALEMAGVIVRGWSMRTLGRAYSRTLRVADDQNVIDAGPYRVVRHPGYLGSIATWTGFAMASRRGLAVVIVVTLVGRAYHRRIEAEETLLVSRLPGYRAYMKRTWRMVPGIW